MMRARRLAIPLGLWVAVVAVPLADSQTRRAEVPVESDAPESPAEKRPAEAPDLTGPSEVAQAGPVDPATYRLGPGDVLRLDLWGRLSRNVLLPVSPEGTIFLPGSGPVDVSGRTLEWARERILRLAAASLRGVSADVRLIRLRRFKVSVVGHVRASGPLVVTSVTRASEVAFGAAIEEGGSRRNIEILHRDGSTERLDLDLFDATGRGELDPTLVDGDVIRVPRAKRFIRISGAVARAGRYELAPGDSLSTLVELGGGLLPEAIPRQSLIVRFPTPSVRESLWVELDAVLAGQAPNLALRDGDGLFVPFRADYHILPTAAIYGEIQLPGSFPLVLGRDRLSDLVRWAGGFRPLANRSGIHLLRETAVPGERDPEFDRLVRLSRSEMTESEYAKFQTKLAEKKNSFRIDWARIQKERVDIDPLLQDRDVVRVDQLVPSVRVEGEVRRPGFVDYAPGRTLRQYVELSGGFTDLASRGGIRVSRAVTGQVIPARSLEGIQPGDFIWVPERKDVDAWAVFRDAVAVLGQVAVIVFTLSRR